MLCYLSSRWILTRNCFIAVCVVWRVVLCGVWVCSALSSFSALYMGVCALGVRAKYVSERCAKYRTTRVHMLPFCLGWPALRPNFSRRLCQFVLRNSLIVWKAPTCVLCLCVGVCVLLLSSFSSALFQGACVCGVRGGVEDECVVTHFAWHFSLFEKCGAISLSMSRREIHSMCFAFHCSCI